MKKKMIKKYTLNCLSGIFLVGSLLLSPLANADSIYYPATLNIVNHSSETIYPVVQGDSLCGWATLDRPSADPGTSVNASISLNRTAGENNVCATDNSIVIINFYTYDANKGMQLQGGYRYTYHYAANGNSYEDIYSDFWPTPDNQPGYPYRVEPTPGSGVECGANYSNCTCQKNNLSVDCFTSLNFNNK